MLHIGTIQQVSSLYSAEILHSARGSRFYQDSPRQNCCFLSYYYPPELRVEIICVFFFAIETFILCTSTYTQK